MAKLPDICCGDAAYVLHALGNRDSLCNVVSSKNTSEGYHIRLSAEGPITHLYVRITDGIVDNAVALFNCEMDESFLGRFRGQLPSLVVHWRIGQNDMRIIIG